MSPRFVPEICPAIGCGLDWGRNVFLRIPNLQNRSEHPSPGSYLSIAMTFVPPAGVRGCIDRKPIALFVVLNSEFAHKVMFFSTAHPLNGCEKF